MLRKFLIKPCQVNMLLHRYSKVDLDAPTST
jgi:hypothetical protein